MCFRFLQVAWAFRRTGELPHTDESHVEGIEPIAEAGAGRGRRRSRGVAACRRRRAMSTRHAAPSSRDRREQRIGRGGLIIIGMPLLIVALCFANYFGLITIPPGPRVLHDLRAADLVMLTGMPISIALGLTVLIFLFTMTERADRRGGAEAVHRHREVRDHGDPVLHPGRQLPHPWRRRAPHDRFRHLA